MNNIIAVFKKQIKETLKNKTVLIQFAMFPVLTIIMENAVELDNMPERFFTNLFAVMFVGMSPLVCMSSIISEEKEKNTLRALMMSNVKPFEYLMGTGLYILLFCMAGTAVFAVCGKYSGRNLIFFIAVMTICIILSMLIGAMIGIGSKNQMTATSIATPVMMIFSFLPMLSMFNKTIERIAKIIFSQQLNIMLASMKNISVNAETIMIISLNFITAVTAFFLIYKKHGLD